jgi:hypothetical protein
VDNIKDPVHNARAGVRIIKNLYAANDGDPTSVYAGYYGGQGAANKLKTGQAVSDPKNPNAPNTREYAQQASARQEPGLRLIPVEDSQPQSEWDNNAPIQDIVTQPGQDWQGSTGQMQPYVDHTVRNAFEAIPRHLANSLSGVTELFGTRHNPIAQFFHENNIPIPADIATQALQRITPNINQWDEAHPGAGIGKFVADVAPQFAIGGPSALLRILLSGGLSAATTPGDLPERAKEGAMGLAGAGGGELIGRAAASLVRPFANRLTPVVREIADNAQAMGIHLRADQVTGNKALQFANSALDYLPTSANMQQGAKDAQKEAWTRTLYAEGGHNYNPDLPNNLGPMKQRISGVYNDLSSRNSITVNNRLRSELARIGQRYDAILPINMKAAVLGYIDNIGNARTITGDVYQSTRGQIDEAARSLRNTDPTSSAALRDIRTALDEAMQRTLSPADRAAWNTNNKDFMVRKHIEKAIDPVTQEISPKKLINSVSQRDPNIVKYGEGPQGLTDIAKVGKQFIADNLPDSGTAQRSFYMKMLGNPVSQIAQVTAPLLGTGLDAVTGGLGTVGSLLLPRMASNLMQNDSGYLVRGMPGYTPGREAMVNRLLRSAGAAVATHEK